MKCRTRFLLTSLFCLSTLCESYAFSGDTTRLGMNQRAFAPYREEGGWTQLRGAGFFRLAQNVLSTNQFFARDTKVIDITTTSVYISSIYAEYGLSERFTALAYLPFFMRVVLNEVQFQPSNQRIAGDDLNSIGDMMFGLKYGIVRNRPFVLSASLWLGLPTGNPEGGETRLLQSGDGELNQLLKLEAGYGWSKTPLYITGGIGLNNRTEDFSDELHLDFEIGYTFLKERLTGIFKLSSVFSFFNGEALSAGNGIFANNTEFVLLGPQLIYQFNPQWGLDVGAAFAVYGRNILATPNYGLGLFYKLAPARK